MTKLMPRGMGAVVVGAVLVVAAAFAVTLLVMSRGEGAAGATTTTAPAEVVADYGFPAPDQRLAADTFAHLGDDGRVLVVMHDSATALLGSSLSAEACDAAAVALDRDAPADVALGATGGVPDPVLRTAFHRERTALGLTLTSCITGDPPQGPEVDLADSVDVVAARLAELDAAR